MANAPEMTESFLNIKDVCKVTTFSTAQIYILINRGEFPRSLRLGPRRVVWVKSSVQKWINDQIKAAGYSA
jgi:prophage regulatory protein